MKRRKLFWDLLSWSLITTLLAVLAVTWYSHRAVRAFFTENTRAELEVRAHLLEVEATEFVVAGKTAKFIDPWCKELGRRGDTRLTLILPDGTVVGDSHEEPAIMDNHGDRPEIHTAFSGDVGSSIRYSHTLQQRMLYVAVPLRSDGRVVGVFRTSMSLETLERVQSTILSRIGMAAVVVAALASLLCFGLSRRLAYPLRRMTVVANEYGHGDFRRRVPPSDSEELGQLADTLNWMAVQLEEKIGTIQRQRYEGDVILESMTEGVLAVGPDERVINMNDAAGRLMGVEPGSARDRTIQEIVRNLDLQQVVTRTLSGQQHVENEIVLQSSGEPRFLEAHGSVMRNRQDEVIGALIVLHDVTRLRRLENVRRDFVANVSHELKTPTTAIKGFVETLLDGAMDEPETARRFLGIMARHADRLTAIIEDLLSLSRLEQESERGGAERANGLVVDVVHAAVDACRHASDRKHVSVEVNCPDTLRAELNEQLMQQALINLIDNAIKFSREGGAVEVEGARHGDDIVLEVIDHGTGIEEKHLPRLFERFYRVDKARSREMGGTGLGLAIVKHVAQSHGGKVSVESEVGKGSRFTLRFPTNPHGGTNGV